MMLAIDRQAEQIRRRDELIHRLCQLILTLVALVLALALLIFAMTHGAAANQVCLTKAEARVLWPKQRIYLYRGCWSNRRGPPRGIKVDPILKVFASNAK